MSSTAAVFFVSQTNDINDVSGLALKTPTHTEVELSWTQLVCGPKPQTEQSRAEPSHTEVQEGTFRAGFNNLIVILFSLNIITVV